MSKVILFDLDGTLLPMDTDLFVKNYIQKLGSRVSHILDPHEFTKALLAGTDAMIRNLEEEKTNEQVFTESFLSLVNLNKEEIWPTLDKFYEETFPTLNYLTEPTPVAKKVVEEAVNQGYRIVIATNPLFPKAAIYERLRWAGINELTFDIVTVYEESVYTKPHVEYYRNICHRLEVKPEDCIMVGNDKQEDMSASQIGMKTFLVHGYVIDRGEPNYPINDEGTLEQLYDKLKGKLGIFAREID
ncbi:haloacid dehalogenase [Anaerobacillus alkalidiazotrophicus]|uniref:Haloacid dehalogenase n=1 Tax=Anaerobacillus alkalidiazotrophicus TaxID=472963 RepID=A0A1S2M5W0_9BACI|nr:HAD family hydrolase [Anaerobacillus alkalidiazotrophicus]OIJ19247.1 haloacid dehalogenase [Anaerobacillus alkalidiazotrophicus]